MNTHSHLKHWSAAAALALAGTATLAAPGTELTRAEVVAQTLAARQAGTLAPAGEAESGGVGGRSVGEAGSSLTRADVAAETRAARASHELIAAGEAVEFPPVHGQQLLARSRAAVTREGLAARAAGELIPAGEGPVAETSVAVSHAVHTMALGAR